MGGIRLSGSMPLTRDRSVRFTAGFDAQRMRDNRRNERSDGGTPTGELLADQRETVTELEFQLWELEQELAKRRAELARHLALAREPMAEASRAVVVHRAIHPKVRIHLGSDIIAFGVAVRGPVRICLDARDRLVASVGGGPAVPLAA